MTIFPFFERLRRPKADAFPSPFILDEKSQRLRARVAWLLVFRRNKRRRPAQLQHNMWVTHLRSSVLSISITGGGKWVEVTNVPLPSWAWRIPTKSIPEAARR